MSESYSKTNTVTMLGHSTRMTTTWRESSSQTVTEPRKCVAMEDLQPENAPEASKTGSVTGLARQHGECGQTF